MSYLTCALRILREYKREAQFSLDPTNPKHIGGDEQRKVLGVSRRGSSRECL